MLPIDQPAVSLALVAAGLFFLTGLLTGVWKYAAMSTNPRAQAPAYVDIAHRASLQYSFAALLLANFAAHSAWDDAIDFWATLAPLIFFAQAILTYLVQGLFNTTDNQFRAPRRLGPMPLPAGLLHGSMLALVAGEIGGFVVLFAGVLSTL